MHVEQKARWEPFVLCLSGSGVVIGLVLTWMQFTGDPLFNSPWWTGPLLAALSMLVVVLVLLYIRAGTPALEFQQTRTLAAQGLFRLPESASHPLAVLNIALLNDFGLAGNQGQRLALPGSPAEMVDLIQRETSASHIRPSQHDAARQAVTQVLGLPPGTVRSSDLLVDLFPGGSQRNERWEALRQLAPDLPQTDLNPVLSSSAVLLIVVALIGGMILLAVHYERPGEPHPPTNPGIQIVGKLTVWGLIFVVVAGVLVPLRRIGRRYASCLPDYPGTVSLLARFVPAKGGPDDVWTRARVEEHLRDRLGQYLLCAPERVDMNAPIPMTPPPTSRDELQDFGKYP